MLLARLARKNEPAPTLPSGRKQFPMAFRDNFDVSIDHFDGGLIVHHVSGGGDAEGVALGNRFAQEVNQCLVNTGVSDASGREQKFHASSP
jgi:hypothetical protein